MDIKNFKTFKHQPEPRKLCNPHTASAKVVRERIDHLKRGIEKTSRNGDDPYLYKQYLDELMAIAKERDILRPPKMPKPTKFKNTERKANRTLYNKLSYLGVKRKSAIERGDDPYYIEEYMHEIRTILDKRRRAKMKKPPRSEFVPRPKPKSHYSHNNASSPYNSGLVSPK